MRTKAGRKAQIGEAIFFNSTVTTDKEVLEFGDDAASDLFHAVKTTSAIALKRTCEIYQWKESSKTSKKKDKIGGGETRTTKWSAKKQWCSAPQSLEHCRTAEKFNTRALWDSLVSRCSADLNTMIISQNARAGSFALSEEILSAEFVGQPSTLGIASNWVPLAAKTMPSALTVPGFTFSRKGAPNTMQSKSTTLAQVRFRHSKTFRRRRLSHTGGGVARAADAEI